MTDAIHRFIALNVRSGGAPRAAALADLVVQSHADVAVLSEAYSTGHDQVLLNALRSRGYVHQATAHSDTTNTADATAIVSRLPISSVRQPITHGPNRQRVLEAQIGGVLVVGAYFPLEKPKVRFWREEFLPYAATRLDQDAILLGDWNSGSHFRDEQGKTLDGAAEFEQLSAAGWIDAWRAARDDNSREYTWSSSQGNGFRLDHAFLAPSLASRLVEARYLQGAREDPIVNARGETTTATDHAALIVDLRVTR